MYAFEYQRAKSVADAAAALAKTGGKALAGGQSLVGAMKLRLANPGTVIDIGGIAELKGIKQDGAAVVIGAMSTHADVASSAVVKKAIPALGFPDLRCVIVAEAQIPHHETPLPRNVRFKPLSIFLHFVWQAQEARH